MYPLERIFHGGLVDILQVLAARLYLGLVHGTIQCGGRGIYHPYLLQGVLSLQGFFIEQEGLLLPSVVTFHLVIEPIHRFFSLLVKGSLVGYDPTGSSSPPFSP